MATEASKPHSSRDFGVLWEMFDAAPNHYPSERAALQRIEEQLETLREAARDVLDYEHHPRASALSKLRSALDSNPAKERS